MKTPESQRKWIASRRGSYPFGVEAEGHSLPGFTQGGSIWADLGDGWRAFGFAHQEDRDKFQLALTNEGTPWREVPDDTTKVKD